MNRFDYSYTDLPRKFYSYTKPILNDNLEFVLKNNSLLSEMNIRVRDNLQLKKFLFSKNNFKKSYSQAYSGHQFGHFTNLGDGRAIMIGEYISKNNKRFDFQIKGSGKTKYSRGGDGKSTLKSMLREYIYSESLHYLNIPTSRSLTVINTKEKIYRESLEIGGLLVRIMKSHIRVGTFEYALFYGSNEDLNILTAYTINRICPQANMSKSPPLYLLEFVMNQQINLVVNWMRIGFIHGVMNTDNTSISGESFDYGPCAFINNYDPEKVYSSIDFNGRYAFGKQSKIIKWNMFRFAETLLPIIHKNKNVSIELAESVLNKFDEIWEVKFYEMLLNKIGIINNNKQLFTLADKLLILMKKLKLDYTNTFWALSNGDISRNKIIKNVEFKDWYEKWIKYINNRYSIKDCQTLMKKNNPVFIPRNNIVEEAINNAVDGNMHHLNTLLKTIKKPYTYKKGLESFMKPPTSEFEDYYRTYCGT